MRVKIYFSKMYKNLIRVQIYCKHPLKGTSSFKRLISSCSYQHTRLKHEGVSIKSSNSSFYYEQFRSGFGSKSSKVNDLLLKISSNQYYLFSRRLIEGVATILLFAVTVQALRVPAPDGLVVDTIIGKDPALHDNEDNIRLVKTIAHRGAGLDAPENSLAAFKLCSDKGMNFIEFDVTLSADNVPIVFHDNNLERMTNCPDTISGKTYEELKKFDLSVKHPFSDRFKGTVIPTLEETVVQLLAAGQNMFIDVKDNNMKMVSVIVNLYEKYPELYLRSVTTSFFPNIIYFIRRRDPKIVCSLAWRPYPFSHVSYNYATGKGAPRTNVWVRHYFNVFCDVVHEMLLPLVTYHLIGISMILLHKDAISGRTVREWRDKGVRVVAWTVNHPVEKQHFARILKVTYMTDTLTGEMTTHSLHN